MTRDPRVDPRPGDVVHIPCNYCCGFDRVVCTITDGVVEWCTGRLGYSATVSEWRAINATAEIVKVST